MTSQKYGVLLPDGKRIESRRKMLMECIIMIQCRCTNLSTGGSRGSVVPMSHDGDMTWQMLADILSFIML